MPGIKRPIEDDVDAGDDNVHPSRKRRLEDGEDRQELAKIFNDLRDEIKETRLEATRKLLTTLSVNSDDQAGKLDYSTTRLIRGVCSGAKAARPGFSIALIEVLRLGFASGHLKLLNTVEKIVALTNLESKLSGAEQRDYLIGRRSAFQAVLQSGVLAGKVSTENVKYLFDAICDLALEKEWLRSECGAVLHMFLVSQEATQLSNDSIRTLIDSLKDKDLLRTPEGVAIWLTVKKSFAEVKLPKGVWNHNNPLSSQERPTLSKILLKGAVDSEVVEQPSAPNGATNGAPKKGKKQAGARQSAPNFAWQVILGYMYKEGSAQKFGTFWEDCVGKAMFSKTASDERKNLGLQIFRQALVSAPAEYLGYAIDAHIVKCIVDQRANKNASLVEATKAPLNQIATRGKQEPAAAAAMACKLLALLPPNIDKLVRATIDALLAAADSDGLAEIVATTVTLIRTPGDDDEGKRRSLADALATIVRSHKAEPSTLLSGDSESHSLAEWLQELLHSLTHLAYTTSDVKCQPPLSPKSRTLFQERLTSCLGHLASLPLHQAVLAPTLVLDTLYESRKSLIEGLDDKTAKICKDARKHFKTAAKQASAAQGSEATIPRAFQLLFALGMLQVYKQELESESILEDILSCYASGTDADETSATMLTELLLSFMSKNSKLYTRMAEQVFAAFAPDVTAESLQSMIDILSQKESLAGQQELFADGGEGGAEEGASDDEDMVDVEEDSDVELVNGEVAGDSDDDSSSGDEASDDVNNDEEAVFDRKLAEALGTTGMEDDEDEDGSDMDDDQMEALDGHLSTIFKERSKVTTKKDKKDAKENLLQFKNKVLDLLAIYVKSQYENVLALDLIHPLVALTRESTNQQTQRKAMDVLEQYFDSCKKNKTTPQLNSSKAGFKLLSAIHDEMRLGGSKLHASACSRSSQFLAKVLVPMKPGNWKKIAHMYVDLIDDWRVDDKSKIHPSIFNDWHSWCMQK
ncbi:rDNA transcriptional regulator pol5 [Fulvia fulva]|uniref:rDNA transcriptional regulator pol5 n=1 Tax=Passalora fulva TaxID=5499 RepID=A0A9Q8PFT8_PASFU|nr:rDNA transcriptional regulator pol5 [Fulvia fulva]UJO21646.1 rDNA transcriptional regulator pol5 [Fulvia fulva]